MSKEGKHHYIPVFYLKQWAGADGRICEFSRPYDRVKARRVFPDATAYVHGLNKIWGIPDRNYGSIALHRAARAHGTQVGAQFLGTGTGVCPHVNPRPTHAAACEHHGARRVAPGRPGWGRTSPAVDDTR
jgi:Protein of unknown function (DUF4238)